MKKLANTMITDGDLEVKVNLYIQYSVPGIFEDRPTLQEAKKRLKSVAEMILGSEIKDSYLYSEFKIDTAEPVLCLLRLSCHQAFNDPDCDISSVTLIWLQEGFEIVETRQRVSDFPYRKECYEEKGPF